MITIVGKRYAKALVELSHEKNVVDKTRADLAAFAEVVDGQASLQKLFSSPAFTPAAKKAVIGELAAKLGLQPTTTRFLSHLAETGRIFASVAMVVAAPPAAAVALAVAAIRKSVASTPMISDRVGITVGRYHAQASSLCEP